MLIDPKTNRFRKAPVVDIRNMGVEVPQHPGLLLPLAEVRSTRGGGKGTGRYRIYAEAICRFCDTTHPVTILEGIRPMQNLRSQE